MNNQWIQTHRQGDISDDYVAGLVDLLNQIPEAVLPQNTIQDNYHLNVFHDGQATHAQLTDGPTVVLSLRRGPLPNM